MNPLISKIYKTGKVEDNQGNEIPCFPLSIPYDTGKVLYDTVILHKPLKTLEVGMAFGLSTLFICQGLKDNGKGEHIAIDPLEDTNWRSIGKINVERAGLSRFLKKCLLEPSEEALPKLLAKGEKFDFIFIDGMHLFDYALVDFFYSDKMLNEGGCIAIDDLWMPALQQLISYILRNRSYELIGKVKISSFWKYAGEFIGRLRRDPFRGDFQIKFWPGNICVLRKTTNDERNWKFHRAF